VQGSFFYAKDIDRQDPLIIGKSHIWSGAIGAYHFFKPWSKSPLRQIKRRRNSAGVKFESPLFFQKNYMKEGFSIELYAGYANGLSRLNYRSRGMSFTSFHKTFGQFGLHWFNELGGISYTFKIGQLQFNQANSSGIVDFNDLNRLERLENNNTFTIRENSFRIFIGIRQMRFFFNITSIAAPTKLEVLVKNGNFPVGVLVDIDECFKKSKSKKFEED